MSDIHLSFPPLPKRQQEYLALVSRGPSAFHSKIADDAFRTFASDRAFTAAVTRKPRRHMSAPPADSCLLCFPFTVLVGTLALLAR